MHNYGILSIEQIIARMCEPLLVSTPPYILLSFSLALLAYVLSVTNKDDDVTLSNLDKTVINFNFLVINYSHLISFGKSIIFCLIISCLLKIIVTPYDIDIAIKLFLIMTIIPMVITYVFIKIVRIERNKLLGTKDMEAIYKQNSEEKKNQTMLAIHNSIIELNNNPNEGNE